VKLSNLFQGVSVTSPLPEQDPEITGVRIDSREITPGDLYLAIRGTQRDGHDFIHSAVNAGAAGVVGERGLKDYIDLGIPYLQVEDSRTALASLAAAWYGNPSRELIVIGVTGTDGKTTTVNLIFEVLRAAGLQAGLISTVNAVIGDRILETGFHVTTPEAMDVQFYLAEMVKAGLTHAVLEATSHGLAQKRVASCEFDIGVVTNITHEHLDYHGDYESYLNAKADLFRLVSSSPEKGLPVKKLAVLNRDDRSYDQLDSLARELELPRVTYSVHQPAQYRGVDIEPGPTGTDFSVRVGEWSIPIKTQLLGDYNVSNCLAAAAACLEGLDIKSEVIQDGISALGGIPGRMERIDLGQDFTAMVDFAHTPNALKRALIAARALTEGQLIAVFGSAGLRDRQKRRLMAEVSAELADISVLTAEDPRTESLDQILEEMAQGAREKGLEEGVDFYRVSDRGEAIRLAVGLADPQDLVVVCGKGHEQSMCFGEVEYSWDDRTATRAALADLLGRAGPAMPYLPTQGEKD
jgi:UDP-N-acetylmuramoyl-L-alanyl-D-glutamate--2,6-diaminopimelate ligase